MEDRIYLKKTINWFEKLDRLIFQVSCPSSGLHWTEHLFVHYLSISFPYKHTRRAHQGWVGFDIGYFPNHGEYELLEIARDIIDNVYLVLLIRDPKDVIPSWLNAEDKELSNRNIISRSNDWNSNIHKYYILANYVFHYEELCVEPIETLTNYFEFIDIKPVEELNLETFQQFDSTKAHESHPGTKRPVKLTNKDRLKIHSNCYKLSEEQRELIWETCSNNMKKLGYWEDGNKWLDKLS